MSKIALIADSACDLSKEDIEDNNIKMLPLRIIYKNREYIDRINISPEEVYSNLNKEIPKTSLPSMEDIKQLFINLKGEGYTHVIAICISSGLSGTYNTIKLISEQFPEIKSYVYDSLTLSAATGAIVLECAKLIESGMPFEEIICKLPYFRSKVKIYYVLETLKYLIAGGRIGKVSGTVGEFLNIKPIISVNDEGVYYTYAKARGRKQSLSKLADIAKEHLNSKRCKVWVVHGGSQEDGMLLRETILKYSNISKMTFGNISPALGVHTGPGLIGLIILED